MLALAALHFSWDAFAQYAFHPSHAFLAGLWRTVYISVVAQALGLAVGLFLELARRNRHGGVRGFAHTYIWLMRGTPLLVQLFIVYDGLAALGLYSFSDIGAFSGAVQAAILTLGLNEGAYMAEIVRASVDAIDPGQLEAAESLGMTHGTAMRRIVLPQAFRVMVPPLGNDFNNMMKITSLLSVIGVEEMFLVAQETNSVTLRTFEVFLAVALYYLVLTTVWGIFQSWLEARLQVGATPRAMTLRERIFSVTAPATVRTVR